MLEIQPITDLTHRARIEEWLTALRSGNYTQTNGALHDDTGFCCLGVACDLYANAHEGVSWTEGQHYRYLTGSDKKEIGSWGDDMMPDEVAEWFGLPTGVCSCAVRVTDVRLPEGRASVLNDNGYSFEKIADLIEAAYLRLTQHLTDHA